MLMISALLEMLAYLLSKKECGVTLTTSTYNLQNQEVKLFPHCSTSVGQCQRTSCLNVFFHGENLSEQCRLAYKGEEVNLTIFLTCNFSLCKSN